jgi:hypothetical protein
MPSGSGKERLQKNNAPLSAEEVAIYRAVLQQYVSDESGRTINVSARTFRLDPDPQPVVFLGEDVWRASKWMTSLLDGILFMSSPRMFSLQRT